MGISGMMALRNLGLLSSHQKADNKTLWHGSLMWLHGQLQNVSLLTTHTSVRGRDRQKNRDRETDTETEKALRQRNRQTGREACMSLSFSVLPSNLDTVCLLSVSLFLCACLSPSASPRCLCLVCISSSLSPCVHVWFCFLPMWHLHIYIHNSLSVCLSVSRCISVMCSNMCALQLSAHAHKYTKHHSGLKPGWHHI